jgi:hypothetical protein
MRIISFKGKGILTLEISFSNEKWGASDRDGTRMGNKGGGGVFLTCVAGASPLGKYGGT